MVKYDVILHYCKCKHTSKQVTTLMCTILILQMTRSTPNNPISFVCCVRDPYKSCSSIQLSFANILSCATVKERPATCHSHPKQTNRCIDWRSDGQPLVIMLNITMQTHFLSQALLLKSPIHFCCAIYMCASIHVLISTRTYPFLNKSVDKGG